MIHRLEINFLVHQICDVTEEPDHVLILQNITLILQDKHSTNFIIKNIFLPTFFWTQNIFYPNFLGKKYFRTNQVKTLFYQILIHKLKCTSKWSLTLALAQKTYFAKVDGSAQTPWLVLDIAKLSPAQSNSNSVGWAEIALISTFTHPPTAQSQLVYIFFIIIFQHE